jgi:hypothetical protein
MYPIDGRVDTLLSGDVILKRVLGEDEHDVHRDQRDDAAGPKSSR